MLLPAVTFPASVNFSVPPAANQPSAIVRLDPVTSFVPAVALARLRAGLCDNQRDGTGIVTDRIRAIRRRNLRRSACPRSRRQILRTKAPRQRRKTEFAAPTAAVDQNGSSRRVRPNNGVVGSRVCSGHAGFVCIGGRAFKNLSPRRRPDPVHRIDVWRHTARC